MTGDEVFHLKHLLQTLQEGADFYRQAARNAHSSHNSGVFSCMKRAQEIAIDYLEPFSHAQQNDTTTRDYFFGSVLSKIYPDILLGLDSSQDDALLHRVETMERATRSAMHNAFKHACSTNFKTLLLDLYPQLNRQQGYGETMDKAC